MAEHTTDGRIGIIDIGSNSIRLVVYDQLKRSPVAIYNEKMMCELGKGLATSGVLNPAGVPLGKEALRRFTAMGRNMKISSLHVIATAAVRDARDGADFCRWAEETHQLSIDVISGKEEAQLGASAICSAIYKPHGITADLGGGSLELVRVNNGHIGGHESLPLGSLRMLDESKGDRDKLRKLIDKRLETLEWLHSERTPHIYAIGGSFRALAKMHMVASHYPLQILHEYMVDAKPFLAFVRDIASMSIEKLEKFPGGSRSRAPALPGAAMVLETLLTTSKAEKIVFSASGIREGYVYAQLPATTREEDGLLSACHELCADDERCTRYASELFQWMQPLISPHDTHPQRLLQAFCLLADVAIHIHPEYRAQWAFQRIMYSAFNSLTHQERLTLALALYHRYQSKLKDQWPVLQLLSPTDQKWARLVGTSANLAYHLSGSIPGNLHRTSLLAKDQHVSLQFIGNMADVMGDSIQKRIDNVDEAYKDYLHEA